MSGEGGRGSNEQRGWMWLERVTRVDAARMSTKVLDAARTNEEGGRSLNEGRAWMELRRATRCGWSSNEHQRFGCSLKRVKRVDVTRMRDKGGCGLNE